MKLLLLTNNPKAADHFGVPAQSGRIRVEYLPGIEGGYRPVLIRARDLVQKGHRLLSHPLSGSVKPGETPYKSILLSAEPQGFSAAEEDIMEKAVARFDSFPAKKREMTGRILSDFALIDLDLIRDADSRAF